MPHAQRVADLFVCFSARSAFKAPFVSVVAPALSIVLVVTMAFAALSEESASMKMPVFSPVTSAETPSVSASVEFSSEAPTAFAPLRPP